MKGGGEGEVADREDLSVTFGNIYIFKNKKAETTKSGILRGYFGHEHCINCG